MAVTGVHHTSFTVGDIERTIGFYQQVLGMRLLARRRRQDKDLGDALFGTCEGQSPKAAEILIADMELGGSRLEFVQYVDPASQPYHGDPSVAGSGHIAVRTEDIEAEYRRIERMGVVFNSPVRTVEHPDKPTWRWCYFRDPDGICVELVECSEGPDCLHA